MKLKHSILPRYERLKEGIRDINKAKYLMENSKELKGEIEALVKSLKRANKGNNGYGSAVAATEKDRELTNNEVKRMRNGINDFAKQYIESKGVSVESVASKHMGNILY